MRRSYGKFWIPALAWAVAWPGAVSIAQPPKATVRLLAATDAIAPGQTVELALAFELQKDWHLYWADPGDSGQPPQVKWRLPSGFEIGPLNFPGPVRHEIAYGEGPEAGVISTNILEGEPVLTATLQAPATIDMETVAIGANVAWLVCKDVCVPESTAVEVRLPVVASPGATKPANETVFAAAARTHPVSPKEEARVRVSASTAKKAYEPGDALELTLTLSVQKGYHIQSHTPTLEGLIPADVFVQRPPGVMLDKIIYPPPTERVDKILGKLSEYEGHVRVQVAMKVAEDCQAGPSTISGVVRYQACDVQNATCEAPQYAAWNTTIQVGGPETAVASEGEDTAPARAAEAPDEAATAQDGLQRFLGQLGLPGLLLACFLYGLFINATPCVLPLLSIKVVGFVQQAHESRRRTVVLGLAFGAGVVVFFVVLGLLASRGRNVLQFPAAVIALGAVVMALGLSLLGVYTLNVPTAATKLDAAIQQEGLLSSFGKGALAPVLGFACTAPLMFGAFSWATRQPPGLAVVAFVVAGLGMASPYMLLSANPRWLSFIPKPGPWMIVFERLMGFALLAMVIWLLGPLVPQIGAAGFQWTMGFLVVVAIACWLLGRIDVDMPAARRWRHRGGAIVLVAGAAAGIYGWIYPLDNAQAEQQARLAELQALRAGSPIVADASTSDIVWRRWSPDVVQEAVRSGKTVFVDFTAAWCTVCKVNKKVAINTSAFRDKIRALDVVAFRADFTSYDPEIAAALRKHGRVTLPLNLIYPAGEPEAPIVLRPNLTQSYLLEQLDKAGPSHPASASSIAAGG